MWRVAVHDDNVNSVPMVVHCLQQLVPLTFEDAVVATWRVDEDGSADVAEHPGQDEAELLAAALQRRGLHATVRRVS